MHPLNVYIDQTILRPNATSKDIDTFTQQVNEFKFYSAVVNPCWVEYIKSRIVGSIKICSVIGFPLGASTTQIKIAAAEDLIKRGCDELDMVMNIGKLIDGDIRYVSEEIKSVVDAAQGRIVKVIIETCLLTDEQKTCAARLTKESGAHFVKTSTGFSREGAKITDVRLLRDIVGPDFGVKASGGIRTREQAENLIRAGASRLGTSAGPAILLEKP